MSVGRIPPHSVEAEENLLSCCLIDGRDVLGLCIDAHISPDSFHVAAHGLVYDQLLKLYSKAPPVPIDVSIVAEEMKTARTLDAVGGYAFLTQVSSRIPTTAQAGYFIEKVREQANLRALILAATGAVEECYNFSGGIDELMAEIQSRVSAVASKHCAPKVRSVLEFVLPKENDGATLLGDRFLCRGSSMLLVSGAGMGKSSMTLQAAVFLALGLPFFGIKPSGPLKSLVIQAEDDDGDIGEVWFSVFIGLQKFLDRKLTEDEVKLIQTNVLIHSERVSRGPRFLLQLRSIAEKVQPDLLWLNPLHAYMDGDITDASACGAFLREGLNGANPNQKWAYIVVHHTTKPAAKDGKKGPERAWNEVMYDMAGSAELINWARAIMILKPAATEGEFDLILAKRGKRAGVQIETDQGWETTTKIPLRHSKGTAPVKGRKRAMPLIFWEYREPEATTPTEEGKKVIAGRKPTDYGRILICFPASNTEGDGASSIQRNTAGVIAKSTFYKVLTELCDEGYVKVLESGAYRRTPRGDAIANEKLKQTP